MTLMMKIYPVFLTSVLAINNAQFSTGAHSLLSPEFRGNSTTQVNNTNIIAAIGGPSSVMIDGDLILSGDWGYGFSIHRMNDDGSTTLLYRDYAYDFGTTYNSFAVNKTRGKVFCGNMNQNFIEQYDYSAWKNGGTGPTVVGTRIAPGNTGISNLMTGYWYYGGLYACGDWLYICRYPAVGWQYTSVVTRVNTETLVAEYLTITRGYNNIGYGSFTYDPITDRLYEVGIAGDGGIAIITDPSGTTPGVYGVYTGGIGMSNDQYPDIYCSGNELVVWTYGYRVWRIDITPCLSSTNVPTVVWASPETNTSGDGFAGMHGFSSVEGLDMACIRSDRDIARASGWVDLDNGVLVGSPTDPGTFQHQYLGASYSGFWKKVTSAGVSPTTYWIWCAYGWYGHTIRSFTETTGPRLYNSWDCTFGTFTLTGNVNVGSAYLMAPGTTPSGCSLSYYASNDNGAHWQAITEGALFDFATTGYQVQIKIAGTGTDAKSSYVKVIGAMTITIFDQPSTYTPSMAQRLKLAGVS